jgi:hypothetical protein
LQKAEAENKLADRLRPAEPQAAAGAVREFSALRAPSRFAFNYTVRDGVLEIVPAAPGYLSITARDAHSHRNPVRRTEPGDRIFQHVRNYGIAGTP